MRYPGLRHIKDPEQRRQTLRVLLMQDYHLCYMIRRHDEPHCSAEHRPIVPNRGGAYCDRRFIRVPYYGHEHWKINYWRKAVTG